jgi:hypothetical protein
MPIDKVICCAAPCETRRQIIQPIWHPDGHLPTAASHDHDIEKLLLLR